MSEVYGVYMVGYVCVHARVYVCVVLRSHSDKVPVMVSSSFYGEAGLAGNGK